MTAKGLTTPWCHCKMNSFLWVPFIFYIFHKVPQKVLNKSFYQKLELPPFAARKFKVKQLITVLENL